MYSILKNRIAFLITLLYIFGTVKSGQSQSFYDISTIQEIQVYFSQSNWDFQLDTSKSGIDGFVFSDSVKINGVKFDSVGVKYKGNSSYNPTFTKNPITISLNEFKSQSYQGYKDIKLSNGYADPSLIREVLSYAILKNYMDCPQSNFAKLFINGAYIGLYANDESIDKKFCGDHFYSSTNTLVKCNPIINPGPNTKSNLKFINSDSSSYYNFYEMKSNTGWKELVALCDSVTNKGSNSSSVLDWDRFLWMFAFNNALVNLDSYSGVFAQNYYLYKNNSGLFMPVVWDLNMSFGGFPFLGSGNTSMGSLTNTNLQQMPVTIHATDAYWPLINIMQSNPELKRKYIAHLKTIVNENFGNGTYLTLANQFRTLIDSSVIADTNKFYTTQQFQNSLTNGTTVGSYTVPGIKSLMDARVNYLQGANEFTQTDPVISNIIASNAIFNTEVKLKATVQNAVSVVLNYRFSKDASFKSMTMYDNGLHDDGAADDKIYGAKFNLSSLHSEYYIYAENNDAGKFSPERAAYEFYSIEALTNTPQKGDIVINEFLALNQTDTVDEAGQHEDWIELINKTSSPLNLFGLYLTDLYSLPKKYAFPANTIIPPYGLLTLFADQDSSTGQFLHCNFKLSGSGEMLLLSDGNGLILDSITFGVQTADVSIARCPNGTGALLPTSKPSFNKYNCGFIGIQTSGKEPVINYKLYPNPTQNSFTIDGRNIQMIEIYNVLGSLVYEQKYNNEMKVNLTDLSLTSGVYLIKINGLTTKRLQVLY